MKNRRIDWMHASVHIGMIAISVLFWYGIYRLILLLF
jgi:hypothetical protein